MSLLAFGNSGSFSAPSLVEVDINDWLVFFLKGQSNAAGQPVNAQSETVPSIYDDPLTSQQFNFPVIWQNYVYNAGAFGPDVAFMETLDAWKPGQIRLLKYAVGGTRLRTNTTIPGDANYRQDWNIGSFENSQPGAVDELYYKSIEDSINPGLSQLQTQATAQGKNIRIIGDIWMQGEADATLNTLNGDDPGLTGAQAKATYKTDLNAIFDGWKTNLVNQGFPTSELQYMIGQLNGGSAVTSRDFYAEIREAQYETAQERFDSWSFDQVPFQDFDGTHHGISGQIGIGNLLANHVISRFAA